MQVCLYIIILLDCEYILGLNMCGIAGFFDQKGQLNNPEDCLIQMTNGLVHRGPDDQGKWFDPDIGVGLGHRRLSILDLSQDGHQPMVSKSGRYIISYNGEVYNFYKLRSRLENEGYTFRGNSDTEVVLSAIEAWGLESAISLFIGMFAFALIDKKKHKLYLVRDRVGIKPLYYGTIGGLFVFASEIKAFNSFSEFDKTINRDALTLYLRYKYIPAPYTIYNSIKKLLPGNILVLDISNRKNLDCQLNTYWSAMNVAEQGANKSIIRSPDEAVEQLDMIMRDAIRLRMLSDVPLGAFLSGGIDSSTVVALMQAQSDKPIKTFCMGFNESEHNEARHAKMVANHLGCDHTELYVTPNNALALIPDLPQLYDEPFSDVSQIPTFIVSKLAREHVTVSLSGDGGDELFYGYNHYFFTQRIWKTIDWVPYGIRNMLGKTLLATLPERYRALNSLAEVLSIKNPDYIYRRIISNWKNPASVVLAATEPATVLTDTIQQTSLSGLNQRMMLFDLISYLPDDILVKLDRASMGVGLEARVPLLDHRIIEFAWSLPFNLKMRDGQAKWILRQVLYKYIPQQLVDRPKKGFGVPIDKWLRGPLREWAEELLSEHRLREEGYFNYKLIRKRWNEHLNMQHDWHFYIWDILMFQSWLDRR